MRLIKFSEALRYKFITKFLSEETTKYYFLSKKKKTFCQVDFTVRADHRVKIKEGEISTNAWTLPENKIIVWFMRLTVIPLAVGAL